MHYWGAEVGNPYFIIILSEEMKKHLVGMECLCWKLV